MFVSGSRRPISRASSRARAWSSASRSTIPSSATSPAAAKIPALWIVAPPSRFRWTRARCDRRRSSPARIAPNGRAEALVQAERDGVDRRGELGQRDAERDGGVRRAARRRGDALGAARARAPRSRSTPRTVPPARVCVFSRQISVGRPGLVEPDGRQARDLGQPVALVDEDVRPSARARRARRGA